MANPQLENGHTRIANEILEKVIASGLNGTEIAVLLFIWRKTYGYQKKEDEISLSQFCEAIPVSKETICNALSNLQLVKIIRLVKKGNSKKCSNLWAFNKDFDTWQLVKKTKLVRFSRPTSQDLPPSTSQENLTYKRNYTKEKTKESIVVVKKFTQIDLDLTNLLIEEIKNNLPNFKEPNREIWASHFNKMLRLDNRTEEQIKYLIQWCQKNSFWQANILSPQKLREKWDTLEAQVKRQKQENNNSLPKGVRIS